ncbi:MAG TPA: alpha-L-glutamate ligase-like protein [Desulfomonilaceae bacterium]|nr:alpha-L-glutamate ligase-like protein [Desulfomonilaceae bacterium]
MWSAFRKLADRGVLAMNRRNADYILLHNPRRLYPLVDDKLLTKQLARRNGIAVPELYAVVQVEGQVRDLSHMLEPYKDFVIKPAHGSGGQGILVVSERLSERFRKHDGFLTTLDELRHHVLNIMSGLYSLGGQPDQAIVEQRVVVDPVFDDVSHQGVPDIRIIVFLGVPVMSMIRLPTRMSDGKANLHQGAIGAGIDIATGISTSGVLGNEIITEHPDTAKSIIGLRIPYWDSLLDLSSRCFELTGLGYLGVDIVLDKNAGPLLLELNARPGLNIQIANKAGLLPRLNCVEREGKNLATVVERIAFAKERFSPHRQLLVSL